ncbi:DUF2167 domain-containing protein [Chitinophaga sedimenti]|uniref:DUF2167 domain-containing protein n=1 Tax=Chitinophaga sedimenti TaxID=2033606 RepID=UPI002002A5B4|nr:DUF2167 domain-containing protein [Chitinophaga sedimenti]MCK7556074.1 DUF2167 domain-containing protein [Chitinophaga sedimenti]
MFKRSLTLTLLICLSLFGVKAAPAQDTTDVEDLLATMQMMDSVNASFKFQTGKIDLSNGQISLNIPAGFKFGCCPKPKSTGRCMGQPSFCCCGCPGMIFPANREVLQDSSYSFVVTYEETGYVKDDDAAEIDYDKMLKQMKEDEVAENEERAKQGYFTIHTVGWAQKPFYDKQRNVLHWAQEFRAGDAEVNTLNYDVRVLGRKGVLSLRAISTINELPLVNANIDQILNIASFNKNYAYSDFDSGLDKVAAVGIGGLVAGKVLAKAGFFAIVLKFLAAGWKFIVFGFVAIGAWVRKLITGRKKNNEAPAYVTEERPEEAVVVVDEQPAADTTDNGQRQV